MVIIKNILVPHIPKNNVNPIYLTIFFLDKRFFKIAIGILDNIEVTVEINILSYYVEFLFLKRIILIFYIYTKNFFFKITLSITDDVNPKTIHIFR